MKRSPRRILGIDPGYGRLGWAVIEVLGQRQSRVASGCITTRPGDGPARRLVDIYATLQDVITTHRPTEAAMERLYFQRNVTTAIGVGQARGVALLIIGQHRLTLREFTPSDVKLATTGYGRAEKHQVGHMVKVMLALPSAPKSDDEADALAIALCAAAHRHTYAA